MDTDDTDSINSNNAESKILTEILHTLKTVGEKDIWSCISPRMLFKYYLVNAQAIASSFVVRELNVINKVFRKITNNTYSSIVIVSHGKLTKFVQNSETNQCSHTNQCGNNKIGIN